MDLFQIEQIAKDNLSESSRIRLDSLLNAYLNEANKEQIAEKIELGFQLVRRDYRIEKFTVSTFKELLMELAKFWYEIEKLYCTKHCGYTEFIPFNYEYAEYQVNKLFSSMNIDQKQLFKIAKFGFLGGLPTVFESMVKKMQENEREKYIQHLFYKYFEKYEYDLFSIQYLSIKYFQKYRPELFHSEINEYILCIFDKRQYPRIYKNTNDLFNILTMHLRYE